MSEAKIRKLEAKIRELEERLNRFYNTQKGMSEVQRSHDHRIRELEKEI